MYSVSLNEVDLNDSLVFFIVQSNVRESFFLNVSNITLRKSL